MHKINNDIVEQLRKGKKEAFELVFKMYYERLHSYAVFFVRDDEIASDIVQNVYTSLWEKKDKIEMLGYINVYLFRSVKNKCHNYLEHQKIRIKHMNYVRRKEYSENMLFLDSLGSETGSVFEKEMEGLVKLAIENLPDRCREVFLLSRYDGLKNREVADKLGISLKAVEKHITVALQRLRLALKDYLPLLFPIITMNIYAV
jgi:RNA polymerase sigma-70 factor, ECF subfamily